MQCKLIFPATLLLTSFPIQNFMEIGRKLKFVIIGRSWLVGLVGRRRTIGRTDILVKIRGCISKRREKERKALLLTSFPPLLTSPLFPYPLLPALYYLGNKDGIHFLVVT